MGQGAACGREAVAATFAAKLAAQDAIGGDHNCSMGREAQCRQSRSAAGYADGQGLLLTVMTMATCRSHAMPCGGWRTCGSSCHAIYMSYNPAMAASAATLLRSTLCKQHSIHLCLQHITAGSVLATPCCNVLSLGLTQCQSPTESKEEHGQVRLSMLWSLESSNY